MYRLLIPILPLLAACGGHEHTPASNNERQQAPSVNVGKSVLFYGSDPGTIIRRYYLNNDFQNILSFISDSSLKVHGKERLENSIMKDSSLANTIQLKSVKWNSDSSRSILTYEVIVMATTYTKHLEIAYENDTPKVVLGLHAEVFH